MPSTGSAVGLAAGVPVGNGDPTGTVTGLTGFASGNFATTAAPGGVAWSTTGMQAVLFRVQTQAVASANRSLDSRRQGAAGRWLRIQGVMASLNGAAYNGVASLVNTPSRAIVASDVGKLMMAILILDTTFIRLWVNRVLVGSTAIVGHTPGAAPATRAGILDGNLEPGTSIDWFGAAQSDSVAVQADIEAWFDAVKATKRMVACPNTATGFVRSVSADGSAFDGSGSTMAVTGALTVVRRPVVWGW